MSRTPFMPLMVSDYLGDTRHLTTEQHGAYLLILMTMWNAGGSVAADDAKLARIAGLSSKKWLAMRETIMEFFDTADGRIYHSKLVDLRQKAEGKREKSRDAGAMGGRAKALKDKGRGLANATAESYHNQIPDIVDREDKSSPSTPSASATPPKPEPTAKARADQLAGEFEAFWRAYPHKVSRKQAAVAFGRAALKHGAPAIMGGLERALAKDRRFTDPIARDGRCVTPHAATWLNAEGFLDEHSPRPEPGLFQGPNGPARGNGMAGGPVSRPNNGRPRGLVEAAMQYLEAASELRPTG